jgi:hypothetical protein
MSLAAFKTNNSSNGAFSTRNQLWLAAGFVFFTVSALFIDSPYFLEAYFNGRHLANAMAVCYFFAMYWVCGRYLRTLMLTMVPLSYIGEIIFCKLLGMYQYAGDAIPLYVPFGHAIVYASGYIFAHTPFAMAKDTQHRKFFAIAFIGLFLGVALLLNDVFSGLCGILFFLLLRRKRWQNLYFFVALCVIYIELLGTGFKCWTWEPKIFGVVPTANPPMGAVFFYAGGDVLLAKIADIWHNRKGNKFE